MTPVRERVRELYLYAEILRKTDVPPYFVLQHNGLVCLMRLIRSLLLNKRCKSFILAFFLRSSWVTILSCRVSNEEKLLLYIFRK